MEVLIMTGTIKPFSNIKYCDVNIRYAEYMENINRYIMQSNFDMIIFAESSGYNMDVKSFETLAERNGKRFEYLDVSKENGIDSTNMSVGDASIIKAVLNRSTILKKKEVSTFWKVSGRLWINNINKILNGAKNKENVFLYAPRYDSVQTWLFKVNKEVLKKYFLTDAVIDSMKNSCIEYVFKDVCSKYKQEIQVERFPIYPDVRGVNSSGNKYMSSRGKLYMQNFLLMLGYYTVK